LHIDRGSERGRGGLTRCLVALALVALVLGSCSMGGPRHGSAFRQIYGSTGGFATLAPEARIGDLGSHIENVTGEPVTLERVSLVGSGVGRVIRAVSIKLAPVLSGIHAIPGGGYVTNPPVWENEGVCHWALLEPVSGFVIEPGQTVRLWVVFEGVSPGTYHTTGQAVTYMQGGAEYVQVMPVGYEGTVSADAMPLRPYKLERPCLHLATLLKGSARPKTTGTT